MKKHYLLSISILLLFFTACKDVKTEQTVKDSLSTIEIIDPEAEQLFSKDSSVQVLASGFEWTEGPLWLKDQQKLIFSDVPTNKIYSWTEKDSLQLYLTPSGYTDTVPHNGEMGSNGLSLSNKGTLVLCQHGDRRIAEMQAPLNAPIAEFKTLAGTYQEKRFNSPNDVFSDTKGNYYFTDPPYGLEKNDQDPKKEIKYQGVYRINSDSVVELLIDTLTRPNGILVSNDGSKLYVANSDPERAIWAVYDLDAQGKITNGKVLFDATSYAGKEKGLPDGMCMNSKGYIFATGPGGVWVFNPSGKHIATIHIKEATSNVELDDVESYLYITADMYLLRLKLNK
jgi:gluconolactonase